MYLYLCANGLDLYIYEIERKIARGSGEPIILNESPATAWVDGNNLLGPVVGMFCMRLAINKAKQSGIGFVTAKGLCSSYGEYLYCVVLFLMSI